MVIYTKKDCPMCKVAKMKLQAANLEYFECNDLEFMESLGIKSLPALELNDGKILKRFDEIIAYIKENAK